MSLIEPTIGVEIGPAWAQDINSSLSLIDSHDHSPGKGVQITPAGLSITSDLTFQNNNLTNVKSVRFTSQGSPLSGGSDLDCIYVSGVDLYYNDGSGNQIRITQGGSVVGPSGSITGLVPPASVTYLPFSQTFVFQSAVNTSANLDAGSVIIREVAANANGITLASPTGLPSSFQITLPAALPLAQDIVTIDNTGQLSVFTVDNSTISSSGGILHVPAGGINTTQLANNAVTTPIIADGNVTAPKLSASNTAHSGLIADSSASGPFVPVANSGTNLTVSGNRSVMCILQPAAAGNIGITATNPGTFNGRFQILRDGATVVCDGFIEAVAASPTDTYSVPSSSLSGFDFPTAGNHVYYATFACGTNCASVHMINCTVTVIEL